MVFFQGLFPPGQGSTIGVDFMIKTIDVNKEPVKVYHYAVGHGTIFLTSIWV